MTDLDLFYRNQDLFRSSIQTLDKKAIVRALLWLRGQAPYPYPTSIHLNLTLRCTARCIHCKQWTWPSHSEFSIGQIEKLFDIFQSWGVQAITFGGGNPLLYPNIDSALKMARQSNLEVGVISEGINMSNDLARSLCQHARWIRFSLDGPSPEVHDKIRNSPDLFNLVMAAIKVLQSHQGKISIGLNCVVQKLNLNYLSPMLELAERIGVDVILFKIAHGKDYGSHFLPSLDEWEKFVNWVQTTAKNNFSVRTNLKELSELLDFAFRGEDVVKGKPVQSFYMQESVHCFTPLFFLTCDSEGNMYPCDYLQADTRIWGGEYGEMRNEFCLGNVLKKYPFGEPHLEAEGRMSYLGEGFFQFCGKSSAMRRCG